MCWRRRGFARRMTPELWFLLGLAVQLGRATSLDSEMGMRQRRAEERVTIDLSALRPSLPGLVLYNYGDQAPKLVQVDLSSLNPQLKPHVIWPQFNQLDLFEDKTFEDLDAIPYLTDEYSLMNPRRLAKTEWIGDNDIYDFMPSDELLSLHESLPLADEVIVPLDWEIKKGDKKRTTHPSSSVRGKSEKLNVFFTPTGIVDWNPISRRRHEGLETEGSQPKAVLRNRQSAEKQKQSWRTAKQQPIPRGYKNALFVNRWK